MDEIALLTRVRPEPAPPTAAERTAVRTALMTHVDAAPGTPSEADHDELPADRVVVALDGPRGRSPRRRRGAALAVLATAAAVVAAVLVVGRPGDAPDRTRAETTTTVADTGIPSPYPAGAYAVTTRVSGVATAPDKTTGGVVVEHRVDDETFVEDRRGCRDCSPAVQRMELEPTPPEGTPEESFLAVSRVLAERGGARGRLDGVAELLQRPVGPNLRDALLGALRAMDDLAVDEEATTAAGAIGARYTAVDEWGSSTVTIDPVDGYVLERTNVTVPSQDAELDPSTRLVTSAGTFDPRSEVTTVVTYARPVAEDPLPEEVAAVAAAIRTSRTSPGGCTATDGTEQAADPTVIHETPLPNGWAAAFCPR